MPSPTKLAHLVESIAQLTPAQRRQLFLRLRAAGLFVPEELQSDRNRLSVATSVKLGHDGRPMADRKFVTAEQISAPTNKTAPSKSAASQPSAMPVPLAPTVTTTAPPVDDSLPIHATAEYRSPVAGRVVVAPDTASQQHLNVMPPVPGQAPEQPIAIIFDGGSRGNPGQGYGSYQLRWPGVQDQTVRLRFGDQATNNEAEYDTLIAALEAVTKRLADTHADAKTATLDIRGDSLLVINQVLGRWEVKNERMRVRRDAVRKLIGRFGSVQLAHHDRENSVKALGH